jgi:probable HAF family extracellular repeat protein
MLGVNSGFSYLRNATAINDKGQIVGYGVTTNGDNHAFLMTPVPIPGAVWLLGSGLAELRRFIKNCPSTKMDANNDGVPCEKQWCN